uniref:Uncharacterized protein n=1 Tax=Anguilla anguilla TaxID=7936 RepID=A0A0E9WAZ0_ANGAN
MFYYRNSLHEKQMLNNSIDNTKKVFPFIRGVQSYLQEASVDAGCFTPVLHPVQLINQSWKKSRIRCFNTGLK